MADKFTQESDPSGTIKRRATISSDEPELVEVDHFPYPYQGAFTVASDIDSASTMRFRAIHALFCGHGLIRENSPEWLALGLTTKSPGFDPDIGGIPGFGFDFADSFFLVGDATTFGMYRHVKEDLFREDEQAGENCAALVRSWFKEGQIDSFHAFLHYTRRQVKPLLEGFYRWCEHEGVAKPRVWINHSPAVTPSGLCPDNLQPSSLYRLARLSARKIVGPLFGRKPLPLRYAFVRSRGDTPGSPYYVNDLLSANGLRFVWLGRGDLQCGRIALKEQLNKGRSTILEPITMDDGIKYYRFGRCHGRPPPGVPNGVAYLRDSKEGFDASHLISDKNLEELCRLNGTSILYTHWTHSRSVPIADETISRFKLLCHWRDEGKIWVTSTARLLEWTRRRTFLRLRCSREGKRLTVDIEGVDDPIFGYEAVNLVDLDGLCLSLRHSEVDIRIAIMGEALGPNQVHRVGQLCWLSNSAERLVHK